MSIILPVNVHIFGLYSKGLKQGHKILAHPAWHHVCFNHAITLSRNGTPIDVRVDDDDVLQCRICLGIDSPDAFETSMNDKDKLYEEGTKS